MSLEKKIKSVVKTILKPSAKSSDFNDYTRKSIEDFLPIEDFTDDYTLLEDGTIVVIYELSQSVSNFQDDQSLKKIAARNAEAFSKIDLPYTFLSLSKSKDMSDYTDYLTDLMLKTNDALAENSIYRLREYVNKKVSQNDFGARGYYLIFSDEIGNIQSFSAKLNFIKKGMADEQLSMEKVSHQEKVDILYIYLNPDTKILDYTINPYSAFFA